MADVQKISGPGSPQDPSSGKRKVDEEKFKKFLEISETDAEQKKKQQKKKDAEDLKAGAEEAVAASKEPQKPSSLEIKFPKEPPVKSLKEPEIPTVMPHQETLETKETKKEEERLAQEAMVAPPAMEGKEKFEAVVEEKKERREKTEVVQKEISQPAPAMPEPFFLPPASATMPGYALLSAEAFQLFEHMVMAITVMQDKGVTETTIHLSNADFSLFAGAQIVIREFSTAPKAFNIEFLGTAKSAALFEQNSADLMKAFQSGRYNFKINRMDSSLLPTKERPLFHRREAVGEEEEEN